MWWWRLSKTTKPRGKANNFRTKICKKNQYDLQVPVGAADPKLGLGLGDEKIGRWNGVESVVTNTYWK